VLNGFRGGKPLPSSRPRRATQKQKDYIDRLDLGYTTPALEALTFEEASAVIDEAVSDRDRKRESDEDFVQTGDGAWLRR
jgi:hypothetical protein